MRIETWQAFLALVVAVLGGGGLASIFRVKALNERDYSNSAVALAEAYGRLIDQLEHRIKSLELENKELRVRIVHLEERLDGHPKAV